MAILGLGLAGLTVAGGGLLWLQHGQPQPVPLRPASTPTPSITSVSLIIPAQYQTITITGSGFGTQPSFTKTTSNYLRLQDETGAWEAGYSCGCSNNQTDVVGVTVSSWTDNQIKITGFNNYGNSWVFQPGDKVIISVWNPQTHAGPTQFTTTVAD